MATGEEPLQTLIPLLFDLGLKASRAIKIKCLLLIRHKYISYYYSRGNVFFFLSHKCGWLVIHSPQFEILWELCIL